MACTACKKVSLENCNCPYTVNTDCVEYKGDKLPFETNINNGSSRSLSSILELIGEDKCERSAKIITGDYEILTEDACKILLLKGDINSANNVTYTITLPESAEFIDKTLILKDISVDYDPSGTVYWEFSENIVFDQEEETNEFDKLAWEPHKVLYLTYLKKDGINYSWVVTSPSIGTPSVQVFTDDDLEGNWEIVEELKLIRLGKLRQLQGMVTGGNVPTTLLNLDAKDRPSSSGYFLVAVDASPYRALLTINTFIAVSFPGGTHLTSGENLSLFGVSWYVD